MMDTITCPRCFLEITAAGKASFCPRCGLADVARAARDDDPVTVRIGGNSYAVLKRLAVGSLTSIYRCSFRQENGDRVGLFKIARDACSNPALANEARILSLLENCCWGTNT